MKRHHLYLLSLTLLLALLGTLFVNPRPAAAACKQPSVDFTGRWVTRGGSLTFRPAAYPCGQYKLIYPDGQEITMRSKNSDNVLTGWKRYDNAWVDFTAIIRNRSLVRHPNDRSPNQKLYLTISVDPDRGRSFSRTIIYERP